MQSITLPFANLKQTTGQNKLFYLLPLFHFLLLLLINPFFIQPFLPFTLSRPLIFSLYNLYCAFDLTFEPSYLCDADNHYSTDYQLPYVTHRWKIHSGWSSAHLYRLTTLISHDSSPSCTLRHNPTEFLWHEPSCKYPVMNMSLTFYDADLIHVKLYRCL